ncbi:MAG: hypothetical protein HY609_03455, partial [Deltaproteobacteria bacterium]|nr:hypothetical protein [Deltaproteobacteria bacterium]
MNLGTKIKELMDLAGYTGEVIFKPLLGGKNNQAFQVQADGKIFFLKHYFFHPADRR